MKTCHTCKKAKEDAEFYFTKQTQKLSSNCKVCTLQAGRDWKHSHREALRSGQRRRNKDPKNRAKRRVWIANNYERYRAVIDRSKKKLRHEVLVRYGGDPPRCACPGCGEFREDFLTVDHKNGDGARHRRLIGVSGGNSFFCWLKKQGYPPGFQILCYNCNCGKGVGSLCPHLIHPDPVSSYEI